MAIVFTSLIKSDIGGISFWVKPSKDSAARVKAFWVVVCADTRLIEEVTLIYRCSVSVMQLKTVESERKFSSHCMPIRGLTV